ncbi:MAG: ABC transporter permease [Acidobacteria bacterium]|jgi:ABC-type antimicrobial peptide transport system permease subunit|nr:ABC transporter permease [Acidobacteriota bacterium]
MQTRTLLARSLRHYWRPNLAVVLGVAAAAAVLGGSLVVGDSVRGSLADTALARLGRTTHAVESTGFFRDRLAADLDAQPDFAAAFDAVSPVVVLRGVATHATSRRRAGDVLVYGVDERFWTFHGLEPPELDTRDALVSAPLAEELGAGEGDAVLVRLHAASDVSGSTLFGRRDDPALGMRLTVKGVRTREELGELALRPRAGGVRAVYVPLGTLQRAVDQAGRANVLLVSAKAEDAAPADLEAALSRAVALDDLGVRVRARPEAGALQLETTNALVDDALAETARTVAARQGLKVSEIFVYLANTLRVGEREVPYSLVAALDPETLGGLTRGEVPSGGERPPIVLNDWAAADLHAKPGDTVTLDYFLWEEEGQLTTASADFELIAVTPMAGIAADRNLVPEYPGITESTHVSDWDPPFPVDLDRIRPRDEAYWDDHRTTPKAFVPLDVGQRLWGHRLGRLTSLRLTPESVVSLGEARERYAAALRRNVGVSGRFVVTPVRAAALESARGSTDFGEYFFYFSFFLVVAALLLAGLFFRLGLEQRLREIGLLEALGFSASRLRRLYLGEGLVLSTLGGVIGMAGAAAYAALVLWGLRNLWTVDLGTRDLTLHLGFVSPLVGAIGATLAAVGAVAWTLRDLRRLSPRNLLAGALEPWSATKARGRALVAWGLVGLALGLIAASAVGALSQTAGFFGAGGLLLIAALLLTRRALAGRPRAASAIRSVRALGVRGLTFRPGRSVLCIALVAFATFVIVSVGSFRKDGASDVANPKGESGGYRLMAWSLVPLHHDLTTEEGRAALGLEDVDLDEVDVARFRARRGEDASCLNLYQPREPTVLAPSATFLEEERFRFQSTQAETPEERANPWTLLERERDADGAVPVIADAGSLTYILHHKLGDVMTLGDTGVRVRFVGTLAPGLFQSEILMGERHFVEAFPAESGYAFFLVDLPATREASVSEALESRLSDFGFDVSRTAQRLRDYHSVENTYIATFQALGALGLLLGIVGLATVLVRNALEQRGELALLRAVGYGRDHVTRMVLAENAVLVGLGFLAGAVPALVAIAPVLLERGGGLPLGLVGLLLLALIVTGVIVSWLAVSFIQRLPLVESLRAE